ncbi:MAG: type IV secretion system DNA-binding domain-containing protein, partial [Desulfurococcales archaeon]|nr:type IV secretion system DNA-binding domain-containing protein [Desulfurococcales archaeon]
MWYLILPRIGSKLESLGDALTAAQWFILEVWRLDGRLRIYATGQLAESTLRRVLGVRREEPPGIPVDWYVASVRQRPAEFWEPLEARDWQGIYDMIDDGMMLQVKAWVEPKALKQLQRKAAELRGRRGILQEAGAAFNDFLDEAILGQDPMRRERLKRMRSSPGEEEVRRRRAQAILDRLRYAPFYIVDIRVYSQGKQQVRELAELVASRFTRPLEISGAGLLARPLGSRGVAHARRIPGPAGFLQSPPKTLLWMNTREVKTILVLPDPSLHPVEFERGSPLPAILPRRRGDVRLGALQDGSVLAVDLEDLYRHLWAIGMTGTGKSTFLWNLALRLHSTGRAAVVVIDPHGDLSLDILESVETLDGVYLLDPFLRPFGLNPLDLPSARDRGHAVALAVDQLIAIFEKILRLPETAVNVRYLLQVLLRMFYEKTDSPTLGDLYNAIVALKTGELDLPVDDPQWQLQVELLRGLQDQTFLSALSRLEPYASNPLLRRITSKTTIDLDKLLRPGSLVVFRLPKGELGEGILQLLAPAIVLKLWFYVLERAMLGRERTPVFVVIDEFQNLAGLPVVDTILSEARKYGLHLVMAHQHTKQLPDRLLQSVFSNTAVKVVFQLGGDDVQRLGQLDRDFADAVRRALTALTVGQAVVKLTARPGEQQPPPVVVSMDPPPARRRAWRDALALLPGAGAPPEPELRGPEELLNPVLRLLPPAGERLSPEELLVLYRVWRASRAGREAVEWSRVLSGLGLRRQRAEDARDSLAAKGYIEAWKEGNRWLVRYVRGLFSGLRQVAPSREGRRIAAKALLWYLDRGYYAVPARQGGPAAPDLIAIPYDRSQLRLRYGEALAVEIESCNEVETHPEQVARNLVKGWELMQRGVITRVEFWTSSKCAQRLRRILEEAARENGIPSEAYKIHSVEEKPAKSKKQQAATSQGRQQEQQAKPRAETKQAKARQEQQPEASKQQAEEQPKPDAEPPT